MIVTRTPISKSNTIVKNDPVNTGLNPVLELNYGNMLSRGLIYFDHDKVKALVEDRTYPDISKMRHVLHMRNAASFQDMSTMTHDCLLSSNYNEHKQRAVSFDLIFFLIPEQWDEGIGFDYVTDVWHEGRCAISTMASNWYKRDSIHKWQDEGIYTTDFLSGELDVASLPDGNRSNVIIGWQHFEHGNEDICLDITDIFNKFITGERTNYGIAIAYSPDYENIVRCDKKTQYVGFFTHHTKSFFEPYIETTYDEEIDDSRDSFYLDKDNRLYFYANVGGQPVNLDEIPTCTIDEKEYEVKQATKGVYYVNVIFPSAEYESDSMYFDVWSNIKYKGRKMPDTELQFNVLDGGAGYYSFGLPSADQNDIEYEPSVSGIGHMEKVPQGDIRKVIVDCKVPYTANQKAKVGMVEYRVYIWMADKQVDVIGWRPVEKAYNEMYFLLDTSGLVPFRYNVDIRVSQDKELTHHRDMLTFDIVSNYTKRKN